MSLVFWIRNGINNNIKSIIFIFNVLVIRLQHFIQKQFIIISFNNGQNKNNKRSSTDKFSLIARWNFVIYFRNKSTYSVETEGWPLLPTGR